ncbi:MAG: hypothetical protein DCC63_14770 [Nitrospira sp.]|nr:MAG: hypothetical protein DCC63_14770 [Nitrospira sp.]
MENKNSNQNDANPGDGSLEFVELAALCSTNPDELYGALLREGASETMLARAVEKITYWVSAVRAGRIPKLAELDAAIMRLQGESVRAAVRRIIPVSPLWLRSLLGLPGLNSARESTRAPNLAELIAQGDYLFRRFQRQAAQGSNDLEFLANYVAAITELARSCLESKSNTTVDRWVTFDGVIQKSALPALLLIAILANYLNRDSGSSSTRACDLARLLLPHRFPRSIKVVNDALRILEKAGVICPCDTDPAWSADASKGNSIGRATIHLTDQAVDLATTLFAEDPIGDGDLTGARMEMDAGTDIGWSWDVDGDSER